MKINYLTAKVNEWAKKINFLQSEVKRLEENKKTTDSMIKDMYVFLVDNHGVPDDSPDKNYFHLMEDVRIHLEDEGLL